MFGRSTKSRLPSADAALPGRSAAAAAPELHFVHGRPVAPPFPEHMETAYFGMGCFWGVERLYWPIPGVYTTAAGYQGGFTPNPTYREVCSGLTGHAEVVLVVYDPGAVSYESLLKTFWEEHDPTQGMRQGADRGTQYRSAVYWTTEAQRSAAESSKRAYEKALAAAGLGPVTTEMREAPAFYYAEEYHSNTWPRSPTATAVCAVQGCRAKRPPPPEGRRPRRIPWWSGCIPTWMPCRF